MTPDEPASILVVDDDPTMRLVLRETLEGEGHSVTEAETARGAVEEAVTGDPDVVVLDIRLPDDSGLRALERIQASDPELPVIMITGDGSRDLGLESVRKGAYDFFTKPFSNAELRVVVERALEKRRLLDEVRRLRREEVRGVSYGRMVGQSPAMREVFRSIDRVADTDLPVLIEGESGTGKELVAEGVHRRSRRAEGPLVKVNCIAIPEGLMESELFGHEEGAFTGATSRKPGKFEQADRGTLFLDEIGDLPGDLQGKLLRVLERQQFERVGGTEPIETDVRVIAATNRRLQEEVEKGAFREDLFYRLNVFPIRLPPVRERREDLPYLVQALLEEVRERGDLEAAGVSSAALSAILGYDWPGNVRELRNALQSAAVRAGSGLIQVEHLPEEVASEASAAVPEGETTEAAGGSGGAAAGSDVEAGTGGPEDGGRPGAALPGPAEAPDGGESLDDVLDAVEESMIRRALEASGGVQARAAERLGIGERSLWYRVKKFGIDPDEYRPQEG